MQRRAHRLYLSGRPVGQYPYFVDLVNEQNISLKNVWFINMDEYLDDEKCWVPEDHPLSFRGFMNRTVYDRIRPELVMPKEQRVFPDPFDTERVPKLIEELGAWILPLEESALTAMWLLMKQMRR